MKRINLWKGPLQNITVSSFLNRLESFNVFTDTETKEYNETLRAHKLPKKLANSGKNENLPIIPFQSSGLLIENSLQNQCQYCLKNNLMKNGRDRQKQANTSFCSYIESHHFKH